MFRDQVKLVFLPFVAKITGVSKASYERPLIGSGPVSVRIEFCSRDYYADFATGKKLQRSIETLAGKYGVLGDKPQVLISTTYIDPKLEVFHV